MAFVRWRGNCAELLTTVYENGKSRQLLLANLPQDYASGWVREQVAREHPDIRVDWLAVERALARGPKAKPTPEPPLTLLQAENLLRTIAQELRGDCLEPWQADRLNHAADILSSLHSDPRLAALSDNPLNAGPSCNATLSSDDIASSTDSPQRTRAPSDDSARPPPPGGRAGGSPERQPRASPLAPPPHDDLGRQQGPRVDYRIPRISRFPTRSSPPRSGPFFFGLSVRTFPEWVAIFFGIRTMVHHGTAPQVTERRVAVLADTYARHPERFVNGQPHPQAQAVAQNVWINRPDDTP